MTDVELREVGDGVFAYVQHDGSWWINTAGFVVTDEGVTVIDSCATRARATALRRAIERTTTAPIRRLINTHAHGDHTYGNEVFGDAVIIGSKGCRAAMLADPVRWSPVREQWWSPPPAWTDLAVRPPDVTIGSATTVWSDDRRIELRPTHGVAHTDHDVIVVVDDVVFVGDLIFSGGTPLFLSGSITGYLEVLPQLRDFADRTLVAGHGAPCGLDEVDANERYARLIVESAASGIAAGATPLTVARDLDLGEFACRSDPERVVLNLHRAYADLGAREFDLSGAFADAIGFNGGPLSTDV